MPPHKHTVFVAARWDICRICNEPAPRRAMEMIVAMHASKPSARTCVCLECIRYLNALVAALVAKGDLKITRKLPKGSP